MRTVMIAPVLKPEITSFEDGVFELIQLQGQAVDVLQSIKERQRDLIRLRFEQGAFVSAISALSEYGDTTIDRLSQATGISAAILYDCRKFYLEPRFSQSMQEVEIWMEIQDAEEKPVHWSRVRNMLRGHDEHSEEARAVDVDKRAHALEKKAREIEFEATKLQEDAEQLRTNEHTRDQAKGVATRAAQVAAEYRDAASLLIDPKPERVTDEKYLQFIRQQPCCVSGRTPVDPHHFLTGGMGTKGSDYATVPLHREYHNAIHDKGQAVCEREWNVSFRALGFGYMHLYFVGVEPR